jgi:glutamate-1-semialdehyde 2,1-aminomutase
LNDYLLTSVGAVAAVYLLNRLRIRLQLSRAKHPSLRGHSKISSFIAKLVPYYAYDDAEIFRSDDAPEEIAQQRRTGFMALAAIYRERFARSAAATSELEPGVSDLQFTSAYRVPFQYNAFVRRHLRAGSMMQASQGVTLTDLDGNVFYDLTGSYGVNVLGNDVYKACIAGAQKRVEQLGPVLGLYHPVMLENVAALKRISGHDEVSFHMSGTEAVMQAVRLARYHTRRSHVVRFCGAYHGWWGDVQPGVGNPRPAQETYTLKELDDDTLTVLRTRRDIACVLVNPLQALHPNQSAPGDSTLIASDRTAHFDCEAYTAWLKQLREVCTARGIALIFDEVFVGFRLALGGAQEYFGVRADLVTYGKTLGGGLPIGALAGSQRWMKRFRDDRPTDICFARGTFNSHPYVMGAMCELLERIESDEGRAIYNNLDATWDARAKHLNERLESAGLPVQVENLSSIWTVLYTRPSRYNWMLQYYLRAEGLALSWVGTGRFIFALSYTDADFAAVADRFVAAAQAMKRAGFFWGSPALTNKAIKRRVLRELLRHAWARRAAPRAPSDRSTPRATPEAVHGDTA